MAKNQFSYLGKNAPNYDYLYVVRKSQLDHKHTALFSFDMPIWVDAVWLGPNSLRDCKETL